MNKKLLQILYEEYSKELYLYIYSFCHNREVADDLMQETFLKAILSLSDTHKNMRAWLYMVARNLYFNYAKKEKQKIYLQNEEYEDYSWILDLEEKVILDEKKKILYQALNRLPDKKKEVLMLQYFGGLSQKQIATILHITLENVRILACRAKRQLKIYMEEMGYDI